MSESGSTESTETDPTSTTPVEQTTTTERTTEVQETERFDADYVKSLRAEAAKYRNEAKNARVEAEKAVRASMSETERAIAEAKASGRKEALDAMGRRLARSEFRTAAAAKGFDAKDLIEDIDLGRFVDEDGEPDDKAIAKAVDRWAATLGPKGAPSFDGGARTTAQAGPNMNQLLRAAAGYSA